MEGEIQVYEGKRIEMETKPSNEVTKGKNELDNQLTVTFLVIPALVEIACLHNGNW